MRNSYIASIILMGFWSGFAQPVQLHEPVQIREPVSREIKERFIQHSGFGIDEHGNERSNAIDLLHPLNERIALGNGQYLEFWYASASPNQWSIWSASVLVSIPLELVNDTVEFGANILEMASDTILDERSHIVQISTNATFLAGGHWRVDANGVLLPPSERAYFILTGDWWHTTTMQDGRLHMPEQLELEGTFVAWHQVERHRPELTISLTDILSEHQPTFLDFQATASDGHEWPLLWNLTDGMRTSWSFPNDLPQSLADYLGTSVDLFEHVQLMSAKELDIDLGAGMRLTNIYHNQALPLLHVQIYTDERYEQGLSESLNFGIMRSVNFIHELSGRNIFHIASYGYWMDRDRRITEHVFLLRDIPYFDFFRSHETINPSDLSDITVADIVLALSYPTSVAYVYLGSETIRLTVPVTTAE